MNLWYLTHAMKTQVAEKLRGKFCHSVARKMKMKEKQKKRKAYEPKLTQEELMDSSTFKRFLASIDNILENLEDVDFTAMGKYQC